MNIGILLYDVTEENNLPDLVKIFDIEKLQEDIFKETGQMPPVYYKPEMPLPEDGFYIALNREGDYLLEHLGTLSKKVVLLCLSRDIYEYNGVATSFSGAFDLLQLTRDHPAMYGQPEYVEKMQGKELARFKFPDGKQLVYFRQEEGSSLGKLLVQYFKTQNDAG